MTDQVIEAMRLQREALRRWHDVAPPRMTAAEGTVKLLALVNGARIEPKPLTKEQGAALADWVDARKKYGSAVSNAIGPWRKVQW